MKHMMGHKEQGRTVSVAKHMRGIKGKNGMMSVSGGKTLGTETNMPAGMQPTRAR